MLARNLQTSHSDLAGKITASFTQVVDFSTLDRFQTYGEAALRMLDAEVNRQAAMIAYINDFYLMMWMTLAVVPFTLLMTRANLSVPTAPRNEDMPH
jgi:DHA2 family multidrug resistance protein